ncbi:class II fumarate hydratase [Verrucomicrobiales bacterium BCK34]|nr:class II fumarate hydratase [Verrucomicrobiales bacterium BCK34]
MSNTRKERDSMGEIEIPVSALWGASTQRAVENFQVSGRPVDLSICRHLALIKGCAAQVNAEVGDLTDERRDLIVRAAEEAFLGDLDEHFVVDVFQTGSGTSTNMNVNEVVANRCSQLAGELLGSKRPVHPNDHVNQSQSSNDTFPSAVHLAVAVALSHELIPALEGLGKAFRDKAQAFESVFKIGRTHLMDATPVRLGQEFAGYARQIELGVERALSARKAIEELPLGGTAVGTGLNCPPAFAGKVIALLSEKTGIPFREASNHFEAQSARDGLVEVSGHLKTIAASLFKISNDLRWLSSGPRCGFSEIRLPATQPGSSIMPGKVNPVMAESMMQVCAQVVGNDSAVTWGGANGNFELNTMMPLIGRNVMESVQLLARASDGLRTKCVEGIQADEEQCEATLSKSLSLVTALAPIVGYDTASALAKQAYAEGRTIREVCSEKGVLSEEELDRVLNPESMT